MRGCQGIVGHEGYTATKIMKSSLERACLLYFLLS